MIDTLIVDELPVRLPHAPPTVVTLAFVLNGKGTCRAVDLGQGNDRCGRIDHKVGSRFGITPEKLTHALAAPLLSTARACQ